MPELFLIICHPKTWKTNSRLNIQCNASLVLIDVIEFLERTKNCENPEAKLRSRRCGKKFMCYQNLCFCCTFSASYIMQSWPQKRTMDKSPIITVNEMVCVAHIGRVDRIYIVRLQPRKRFVKCLKSFWWKSALEPSSWISVVHPIGMQTCLNNFCPHNDPFQIEFSPPGQ